MYNSIRPGEIWLDTEGKPIQAHAGAVMHVDDTFYWYGENKEKTVPGSDIWHWGVKLYSSKDLYNWTDEGIIIPPEPDDISSPMHPSQSMMDRPHILFNKKTQKYVCWIKCMQHDGTQKTAVFNADNIKGPYVLIHKDMMPLGMSAGDFDLSVADDGKAYYYFERVHSELICADLTDDYTNVTGYYSTHFPYKYPPFVREAPAYFTRRSMHYLATSGTTGYHPNPSMIAVADTFHGPWRELGNLHPDDASRTSFNSQISYIFKHPGKKDLYIAIADRWLPHLPEFYGEAFATGEASRKTEEYFRKRFNPDEETPPRPPDAGRGGNHSRYVWLPISFDGEYPQIKWQDEWRIEDFI
ncbi:MAG: family 43 glycosylhydrolase [Defluviitaleaceae bacterium]|nr:family 43 glycosylhydrolase [Defluviitaleaceae bacterium]